MSMTSSKGSSGKGSLLSKEIESIRAHRQAVEQQAKGTAAHVDAEWASVLEAAAQLRQELAGHERLRYFHIARDSSEVSVAFNRDRGPSSLSLSRRHPDGKYPNAEYIWCRELGCDDQRFVDGESALRVLIKHCAGNVV